MPKCIYDVFIVFKMAPHKKYEKIKHLGEGQFAHVYQARDTESDDIGAINKV